MGLWSRLAAAVRGEKPQEEKSFTIDEWWDNFGGSNLAASGITVNQISSLQVSSVMACVAILAEDVAKLPLHVYRRKGDGGKVIAKTHPLERLFQQPNNWQTRFEFVEMLQTALLLRGNAYAAIVRDSRGNPISLVPINPDRVWIYESPDGNVFYTVSRRGPHDMATLESLPLMVHSDDMFHLRWISLDNSLWGVSRIGLAREAIGLSLSQQELSARLAGNNTNLGGVLQTDQKLSADVVERLKKDWKDKYGGLRNAGAAAVLEQGLTWKPLGMTAQDAEFLASRQFQVLEIARIFRMPPHKLGVMEHMAGGTLEQIDQDYMNNTVSSYLERWESKLTASFGLVEDDLFIEFDVTRFLRASLQTRYTAYRTGIIGSFLTPNEVRRAEGLPDMDGGDDLLQPVNMGVLGEVGLPGQNIAGPGSDTTGKPGEAGDGDPAADPSSPDEAQQSALLDFAVTGLRNGHGSAA